MWEERETKQADEPDNGISVSSGEQKVKQKANTVIETIEEENEISSDEEEFQRYRTSFEGSFPELSLTQSGLGDSKINSILNSRGLTSTTVNTKPQFKVLVHAQTSSEVTKGDVDGPSLACENEEEILSESNSLENNSHAIFSPSSSTNPEPDVSEAVCGADVTSVSESVTTNTSEGGDIIIDRTTHTTVSPSLSTTQQLNSQHETGGSEEEITESDLHIDEPEYRSHLTQSEIDVLGSDEDKATSSLSSSQSSSISSSTGKPSHLTRHGHFSGSETDTVISRSPSSVRVHSERPGGWEGTSHELVYPLSPDEWRREARRRKWHSQNSNKPEVESVSFIISIDRKSSEPNRARFKTTLQHSTLTVADQKLPPLKLTSGKVNTISFRASPEIYGTDEIPRKMTDKQALVERSEFFEESSPPDKLTKDNVTPLNFRINPVYPVYAKKSPDEHDTVMSVDYTKGVGSSETDQTSDNGRESETTRWEGRVNPFNEEEPDTDDVFTSGIIDLDGPEAEAGDTKTSDKDSADDEPGTIPSKKSLSEAEEQINFKTQFKDVYYNIGSTEDLLKELAADDERDGDPETPSMASRRRSTPSRTDSSAGNSEVEEKETAEGEKGQDNDPLIEDAGKENKENMPFGFLQKKKEPAAEVVTSKPEADVADKTTKSGDVIENGDAGKQSTQDGDSAKVKVEKTEEDGKVAVSFTATSQEGTDGADVKEEVQSTPAGPKTEKSPLITAEADETPNSTGKESKVRDHSPGFLCCTIL